MQEHKRVCTHAYLRRETNTPVQGDIYTDTDIQKDIHIDLCTDTHTRHALGLHACVISHACA